MLRLLIIDNVKQLEKALSSVEGNENYRHKKDCKVTHFSIIVQLRTTDEVQRDILFTFDLCSLDPL